MNLSSRIGSILKCQHWPRLQNQFDPDQILIGPRSGPNLVMFRYQTFGPDRTKAGPAHMQGPQSHRIWPGTKSGYVNAPCSSDQTKCLTFGGNSQSSNKNGELATWCKLVKRWNLDYYKNLEFIMIANIWRKMINLALLEHCFFVFRRNPKASWQSISEHVVFFPGEPKFVICQFSPFCYPKVKEDKMTQWKFMF